MEEMVVETLTSGDREAQTRAASELRDLSHKQRQKLGERGVIPPLISMLRSGDCEAVEASLSALLSLAFGSERNKIRIARSGIVPVLLELIQAQSEPLLIESAVAFLLILSSCTKNKLEIASSGAIPLLLSIIGFDYHHDSISIQAKADAIATLQNLSTNHRIMPLVISSNAACTMLQVISSCEKSSELYEKAVSLLEQIVSFSPESVAEVEGAIRVLVEAVEEGSAQCTEHAVGILLGICKSCRDKYRGLILMEGVMPGLLQVSVDGTWRAKEMARELLLLLRDCSSYGSRSKQSKHEVIERVMREIDADKESIPGTTLRLVEEMIAKLST